MRKQRLAAAVLCGIFALCGVQQLPAGAVSLSEHLTVMAAEQETEQTTALPSSYDMRKAGLTTRVQNQGSNGICWSFSAMAALESTLVSKQPDIDLSEWSMAFYAFSPVLGYKSGEKTPFKNAGGLVVAAPMLTGWYAPVPQEDFSDSNLNGKKLDLTGEELRERAVTHVSEVEIYMSDQDVPVTEELIETVKQTVYDGRAVSVIYYNEPIVFRKETSAFYNSSYDKSNVDVSKYHAVTIVGWDDDFPAGYFNSNAGRDGAFLCKNSWGLTNSDNGYFWLSYAEPSISELYSLRSEPVQKHSGQYQYDTYGFCRSMAINTEDNMAYMANIFKAEEDTVLTSVMFVTAEPGDDYSIRVYKDVQDPADPQSGTQAVEQNGSKAHQGYYTEDLETPVFLSKGERFSIVVKLSGKSGKHIACEAYASFTTEKPDGTVKLDNETLYPESMIVQDFHPGESFVSTDGLSWSDMYEFDTINRTDKLSNGSIKHTYGKLGNVCIRALTQGIGKVMFSEYCEEVPEETEITLTCPGAEKILWSTDGEQFSVYEKPIPISGKTDITAYAMVNGKEYPPETQHYQIAVAQISSMVRTDTKEYVEFERIADDCWTAVCKQTDADLTLLPVTTGEILASTASFTSYSPLKVLAKNALTLHTREAGKRDGTYVFYMTDAIKGNVNLDDAVNAKDATEVLIYAAQVGNGDAAPKDAAWIDRADWDGNHVVNAADATGILQYAAARGVGN